MTKSGNAVESGKVVRDITLVASGTPTGAMLPQLVRPVTWVLPKGDQSPSLRSL